ncbi:ATP-binding protein [Iamia sp. SCSIO 61187]|uniref:ATP-binding protein n=1 Tax=Iamia sp. SCSIO 61187 TaxID=2722752 RepID=UPI001C63473E|nr:ATP-binding protein [Iamia sp. SCSIO 61187]QYG92719.1 ATP-binding protein [Iamia sp. SCSIO 61187]
MSGEAYDPVSNPYAPGAGTPPPALVGRDAVIDASRTSLRRLRAGRSTQHVLLTGLRGVGKTVLLRTLAAVAEGEGFRVIRQEAVGGDDTVISLLRQARRIMEDLGPGDRVGRALRSIESVALTVAGTGFELGRAGPSPDREALADVVVDLGAAAAEHDLGIVLAIDEAQGLAPGDLRRILAGVHRAGQDGLPVWCVLAGLPNLVGVVAKAATYAERLFTVEALGPLTPDQVVAAVVEPADDMGVGWAVDATSAIADLSDGYPFFVQVWAYHTWNAARDEPISRADVDRAGPAARLALDTSFFAARIARVPDSEVAYVRLLASLGPGPHRSGEVAAAGGRATSELSAIRDRLIKEGLVYAPRYGWVEFALPRFDEYVRRTLPPP